MMLKQKALMLCLGALLVQSSFACTDFASVNGANNSVLINKNRDEVPDLQSVVAFHPFKGYSFMGLVSQQQEGNPYVVRAGINQYGLAIVNMAAGILKNNPTYYNRYDDGDDFMRAVLTGYQSIAEVMGNLPALVAAHPYPEFYLLADRQQTALIELAPGGQYVVTTSDSEPLYHTNNYEAPGFAQYNTFYAEGSMNRYDRIADLMNSTSNYSMDTFITFAHDHAAGSNDSIFRTGLNPGDPKTPRTLATFIASIPKASNGAPTVYVQFYPEPNISGPSYTFNLTPDFWKFKGSQKVLAVEQQSNS